MQKQLIEALCEIRDNLAWIESSIDDLVQAVRGPEGLSHQVEKIERHMEPFGR